MKSAVGARASSGRLPGSVACNVAAALKAERGTARDLSLAWAVLRAGRGWGAVAGGGVGSYNVAARRADALE